MTRIRNGQEVVEFKSSLCRTVGFIGKFTIVGEINLHDGVRALRRNCLT
jgi:hypothetical protein